MLGDLWGPNVVIIGRFLRSDEYIFAINGVPTIVTSPWEHFNRGFQSSRFVYIIIFIRIGPSRRNLKGSSIFLSQKLPNGLIRNIRNDLL